MKKKKKGKKGDSHFWDRHFFDFLKMFKKDELPMAGA